MKEFKVLKIIDRFGRLFEQFGVDYEVMRKILQVKLIMDGRRVPTIIGNGKNKVNEAKDSNNFLKSLWLYALLGIILVPITIMGENFIYQMSIIFGILMFMVMTSMISDFSAVLLDVRDKNILFTKPVNRQTINMAKLIHIIIYMFFITISLVGTSLIAALIRHGIVFFLVYSIAVIFMDFFIVVLSALLYLIILKFFDGEKLKDIINYFQIGLTIVMSIGYQLIGRVFSIVNLELVYQPKWWQYFIPPIWFGGFFELIFNKNYTGSLVVLSMMSIIIPLIAIFIYIKLIPTFENNLQKLNNNSAKSKKKRSGLFSNLYKILIFNKEEKILFQFTTDMMKKERDFKLRVYPSIGFAIIFPIMIIFMQVGFKSVDSISMSKMYFSIYLCAILIPTALMMIKHSTNYKGAWIFKVLPIESFAAILKGSLKAVIINLLTPIFVIQSFIFMFIFGVRIFPDLLLVFLNLLVYIIICFCSFSKALPFSQPYDVGNGSDGVMVIVLFIVLAIQAGIHFFCSFFLLGRILLAIILILTNFIIWKITFRNIAVTLES
ncbi:MAG: hypothetical protein CVU84_15720 [Firmicutes bacterium HGW-Firmicutes-1]|jgi:hypothetical protein|nr:MAG: hypothetical protein CVU84_15720 [Firmicutes bacterium HGW-Firmicutes-1]